MKRKIHAILFFLLCISIFTHPLYSQESLLKGRILDAGTREPLAFVNIVADEGPAGAATDIDGKFVIRSGKKIERLKISYVGYQPLAFAVEPAKKEQLILLSRKEVELSEVVIKPGINPAHRIIRSVLENRNLNNHEKLNSFSYTTYEKTTFRPEGDSLPVFDSLAADSAQIEMRDFFERQHLFLMESVTERKFLYPDKNYNKVIASRVSGFGDPLFVFLMSQLQSTSFYRDIIKISDKDYINPISPGSLNKYYFEIQDTLIEPYPYDTTYIISFRPLLNTNFDGLKGVVSISTHSFAIRNVIAEPAREKGIFTLKIQQLYDFIQDEHWFPLQLNTDLIFKGAIGKGSISVGVGSGTADSTRPDLVGSGKSYLSNIKINPEFKRREFSFVEVDVQPNAYRVSEPVWNQYRSDSLSLKDLNTYRVIDSIGKAANLDRMGYKFDALINGKVPIGFLDLELDKILRINQHEGFRLGAGLHTNDRLLQWAHIGGYAAYGFKDKSFKYGAKADVIFNRFHESGIGVYFSDDLDEAGADNPFDVSRSLLDLSQLRLLLVDRMDHTIMQKVSVGSRMLKYMKADLSIARSVVKPQYNYQYKLKSAGELSVTSDEFRFSEASLLLRYAYGEKFIKNTRSIISMGTTYPVLWILLTHGFEGTAGGQFEYDRLELQIQKTFTLRYLGKSSFTFRGGITAKNLPYCNLFNGISDHAVFTFYAPNSFATMRFNEFTADRFAALFLKHDFGKLLYSSKHFNPHLTILTNLGMGFLSNPGNHLGIVAADYRNGYLESGLLINNLLNLGLSRLGLGAFYRYGYYSLPKWQENLSFKLSLEFVL